MFAVALLLAAQPLALGHIGPMVQVTRAHQVDIVDGASFWQTVSLFGVDAEVSAIDLVARQKGPLRVGDLLGVTLIGGNKHSLDPKWGTNNLLSGSVEVRGGVQAVLALNERVDLGVDGGGCLCAFTDEPRSKLATWFAHARLRYDWFGVQAGYDHDAPMAGAFALFGPLRANLELLAASRPETTGSGFAQDRDWWTGRLALLWQFR